MLVSSSSPETLGSVDSMTNESLSELGQDVNIRHVIHHSHQPLKYVAVQERQKMSLNEYLQDKLLRNKGKQLKKDEEKRKN